MTPIPMESAPAAETDGCCSVAAYGTMHVTPDGFPALRQNPGPSIGEPFPPSFLKHADEQTVAGLAAVLKAVHRHGLAQTRFTDWGVIAASHFLGRATLAVALQRFAVEGAWGVSPHLIPHRSLHSVSGTISQALQIHGPNFGVGGGPGGAAEAMLVAAALMAQNRLPGLWVVLTGWDSEPVLDLKAASGTNSHKPAARVCGAAALALTPSSSGKHKPRLHIGPAIEEKRANGTAVRTLPLFTLEALLGSLPDTLGLDANTQETMAAAAWRLEYGGLVRLEGNGGGNSCPALSPNGDGAAEGRHRRLNGR